jgi:hypothetical protein
MVELILTAAGYVVGLPLEVLVIAALLHGGYRQFPAVFAYIIAEFLTTVVEIPQALAWARTHDPHVGRNFALLYWRDEIILQFLVFVVVISLIWQATSVARSRRTLRVALIVGVILFAGLSLLVHFTPPPTPAGVWLTAWKRDLNFGSAILDMALWAMLIAKRQKDSRVLMLSGGLGVMFAGEAIGESLRNLSRARAVILPGSVLVMIINLLFLYIWWQTFRAPRAVLSAP